MVSNRQRRRALARAKWQRQQARRTAAQRRARTLGIIGGAVVAVVAVILVGWGVVLLVQDGDSTPTTPSHPFPSLQPSKTGPVITELEPSTTTTPTGTSTTGATTGSGQTTGSTTTTSPSSPTTTTGTGN